MKRMILLLLMLALVCMLPSGVLADAAPIAADYANGKTVIDAAILKDGDAATSYAFKGGQAAVLTITLPEGAQPVSFCVQLKVSPASVTLKQKNDAGKYTSVQTLTAPGAQFVLTTDAALSSSLQLEIAGVKNAAVTLQELRIFSEGDLPADVHAFLPGQHSDILYIVPAAADVDAALLSDWAASGRTLQVLCLTAPEDESALADMLWAAGVDRYPAFGDMKALPADATAQQAGKAWADAPLTKALTSAIRASQAQLVVYDGSGAGYDRMTAVLPAAAESAKDYTFNMDDAAQHGLWAVSSLCAADSQEAADAVAQWEDLGDALLRQHCADQFADALHGDVSAIPYPARLEDGYLAEGEFLWEDPDNGLWAYLSPTLQIEIIRYEQPDIPRCWFVSDIKFKPEAESFHQQVYVNATFPGQMIYPETLAQTARLVYGINSDYYIYREDNKATGNIIRNRKVLYNHQKSMAFPNLDTMALRDDGSISVYDVKEITADELLAQGDVHDALSFGPYLVRDGELRVWAGKNCDAVEPRNAIGMVEPGHFKVITVEGRFNKGYGPAGVTLNMLAEMLYSQDVEQGFNLDGGNTSVLIFMGEKLNRTAAKSGKGETSPRNMAELFGIGASELVHTDKLNGK